MSHNLTYHGVAVLSPETLAGIEARVNAGYAFWLEVEPDAPNSHWPDSLRNRRPVSYGARLMVGDYVSAPAPESGSFLGFRDEHDRDVALHALSTRNKVRLIHPFSRGRGLYTAEAIVSALLGSEAMRLSVIGALGSYQRANTLPLGPYGEDHKRDAKTSLLSSFRGGLEAARGEVKP